MGKIMNKLADIFLSVALIAVAFAGASRIIYNRDYNSGNGYPPHLKVNIPWEEQKTQLRLLPKKMPNPDLLEGLEYETISKESLDLSLYYLNIFKKCSQLGLSEYPDTLTEEEIIEQAGIIHNHLDGYYGIDKEEPSLRLKLEETIELDNMYLAGEYHPFFNKIALYNNEGTSIETIKTLVHEESHVWIGNETLNELATLENLIRISKDYEEKYISNPNDTKSGEMACLYRLGAASFLSIRWDLIEMYLLEDEYLDPSNPNYNRLLDHYLIPALMARHTSSSTELQNPEIKTLHRYSINLSETAEMINRVTHPEKYGRFDLFSGLAPAE